MNSNITSDTIKNANNIKNLCPAGSRIDFQLCHVSKSKRTRDIALFYTKPSGEVCDLSYNVAALLGLKMKNNGIRIGGVGMDMAWFLITKTANLIYDDQYAFQQGSMTDYPGYTH